MTRVSALLALVIATLGAHPAQAAGRTLAVLEFRAGVRAGRGISARMAAQIARLTSHKVITPADAKRRLGPRLQATIADCKGVARCIGKIGARLEADEVILVGLSQLGDLILAIQRIEVGTGRVLSRLADALSARRPIDQTRINRYLEQLLPPDDFLRYGRIIIRSQVVGDQVLLNGKLRGRTPMRPIRVLAPARYLVRVRRAAHIDFVTRLHVLPDAAVEVTPTLAKKTQPRQPSWYERWWVWAIIGGVVAGGATTAAILARPGPSDVDAVVRWSR